MDTNIQSRKRGLVQHFATIVAVFACVTASLLAGITPSKLEVNLGPFPIDRYFSSHNGFFPDCPANLTVRGCVRNFFNNNPAYGTVLPNNYISQGVTGVRFQFGLGGGEFSTPFDATGAVRGTWATNLVYFFNDLKRYGIQRVTPTPVIAET